MNRDEAAKWAAQATSPEIMQSDREFYAHLLRVMGAEEWIVEDARAGIDDDDAALNDIARFRECAIAPLQARIAKLERHVRTVGHAARLANGSSA